MTSPVAIVRQFRHLRVLVIGDAMLDTYLEGNATRLCSEGPVPVVRQTAQRHAPGGAANTAANLCALGAEVLFVGLIGADPAGSMLRAALRDRDVPDDLLVSDPGVATLHKQRILADDQYVVRFDAGDTRCCSAAGHRALLERLENAFARCDVAVVSDYRYGVLSDALIARLGELHRRRPVPLVVDSKDLHRFRCAGATVITPNHLEAQMAVEGRAPTDPAADVETMRAVGGRLLDMLDCRWAAITLGAAGVLLLDRDGMAQHLPAHPVARANDVGAGDSFTAALALALAAGAEPIAAARIGLAAAGLAVARPGTALVQQQELLQWVGRDGGGRGPSVAALAALLAEERRRGRRIVFTNGVFDILHAGHVHFLRQARALGDVLVVGVNTDASAGHIKGKNRPIVGERERLALVSALDPVDHVILFDQETPADLIRALCPDVHVKGGDYQDAPLPEAQAVRDVGGEIVILPLVGDLSTTGLIERIMALAVTAGVAR